MTFRGQYHRSAKSDQPREPEDTVVSIDVGTVNLAISRIDRFAEPHQYSVHHLVIVNVCGPQGQDDVDTVATNLFRLFADPKMAWVWSPPVPIVIERQVDHIWNINKNKKDNNGEEEDDDSAEEKKKRKPAIMHAIYGMIKQIVLARRAPVTVLDNDAWAELYANNIDPSSEAISRGKIEWVPRSGSQKSGLKGFKGDARKAQTHIAAPIILSDNKDHFVIDFIQGLKKPKPAEDACDVYLQGHHYLDQRWEEIKKQDRKDAREANKAAKLAEKQARQLKKKEKNGASVDINMLSLELDDD